MIIYKFLQKEKLFLKEFYNYVDKKQRISNHLNRGPQDVVLQKG
jgi:hypothetical protein